LKVDGGSPNSAAFFGQFAHERIFSCGVMSRPVVTLMQQAISRFEIRMASGPSIA
jgi:hypothetical protein